MKTIISTRTLALLFVSVLIFSSCHEVKKQIPPTEVSVVSVLQKDVPIIHEFIGQTYGIYDIPIRARVQGFLEGIHFDEGTVVKKGAHLYSIDPQSYKANVAGQLSAVAGAKTGLVKAESDLNRYKPLAAANAVSQSDLDNAIAQYDASVAQVAAAEANYEIAQIELGYTEIYSPIDGIIGKTNAKVGEFVGQDPNPVILNTVSDVSSVNVEFFLPEAQYLVLARHFIGYVEKGRTPTDDDDKYLELELSDGSIFDHRGDVVFIDREVNPSTGSLLVQARFPNPDGLLRPGQYAKVKAHLNNIKGAILVPQSCVIELQGQYSVFIVDDSSHVQTVQVEMGPKVDDYWVVSEGLASTDKVIFDGVQKVGNGMKVIAKELNYTSKALKQ